MFNEFTILGRMLIWTFILLETKMSSSLDLTAFLQFAHIPGLSPFQHWDYPAAPAALFLKVQPFVDNVDSQPEPPQTLFQQFLFLVV